MGILIYFGLHKFVSFHWTIGYTNIYVNENDKGNLIEPTKYQEQIVRESNKFKSKMDYMMI